MKATGKVRKIDDLGRIVIPTEIRKSHGFNNDQEFEIYRDGDFIVIEKYVEGCIFCNEVEALAIVADKLICKSCTINIIQKAGA